jgi:hypothetical protein
MAEMGGTLALLLLEPEVAGELLILHERVFHPAHNLVVVRVAGRGLQVLV